MRERRRQEHSMEIIFTMTTFLAYAASMLALVYMGAAVYRRVTARMDNHYAVRTAQAYVVEKVRQNDRSGALSVADVEGNPALAIRETIGDQEYVTYIYTCGGSLREMMIRADREPAAQDGNRILDLEAFSIEETADGDLIGTVTDREGICREFWMHPDSAG